MVRAVLGRELTGSIKDRSLLMLERVRVLDMAYNWSKNTHKAYQAKVRVLKKFENDFKVSVLQGSTLTCPPHSPAIPTMWAQQRYAVAPRQRTKAETSAGKSLQGNTVRGLRSAASQFFAIDKIVANPQTMMDPSDRLIVAPDCLPTDEAGFLWMSKGMKKRMGDDVTPAKALLERHVRWIDDLLEIQWTMATNVVAKAAACRAATANLAGWLSWLRGGECFSLRWEDTTVVQPCDGPTLGLPPGDAYLQQYDGSRGDNTIKNAFWSFHSYRHGAKTHVSCKRPTNQCRATRDEENEHARWRRSRSSMDLNNAYTDWSYEDHVMITLMCM